ncbi:MAG TPA: hypothetical protein VNU71_13375 [Burkholderiaceae bacterium]|nr:hypothetical protein [Burkholderiaceae bacterium]
MNCKPNDVAMVVRNTSRLSCVGSLIGTPVEVVALNQHSYGPVWRFKGPALRCGYCGTRITGLLDADLQPLRPPPVAREQRRITRQTADDMLEALR